MSKREEIIAEAERVVKQYPQYNMRLVTSNDKTNALILKLVTDFSGEVSLTIRDEELLTTETLSADILGVARDLSDATQKISNILKEKYHILQYDDYLRDKFGEKFLVDHGENSKLSRWTDMILIEFRIADTVFSFDMTNKIVTIGLGFEESLKRRSYREQMIELFKTLERAGMSLDPDLEYSVYDYLIWEDMIE